MTWSFLTRGGADETPISFDATVDGPVEEAAETVLFLVEKAKELHPDLRQLCYDGLNQVVGAVRNAPNGKRRFSMNLSGGLGVRGAWTLRMELNLAEDPEAK